MRFARVITAHNRHNPTLDRLLETADLDVLQLDYVWPHGYPKEGEYAAGFLRQLRLLHKAMYLDPQLHVVTNAGGGSPRDCVETVAEFLCEHGSAELPLTLIRGNNLLPRLPELIAAGLEFRDQQTGKPYQELPKPPFAAHVELGAGPIAAALSEGSRLVIAGCYDVSAPAIAATVTAHYVLWDDFDALAYVAVASNMPHQFLEIEQSGEVILHRESNSVWHPKNSLSAIDPEGNIHHADVCCHIGSILKQEIEATEFSIAGVKGESAGELWRLRLNFGNDAEFVCNIPRDLVAVSVDTRTAKEWR